MKLLEKEKNIEYLFNYFDEHEDEIVKVVFKDRIIEKAQPCLKYHIKIYH